MNVFCGQFIKDRYAFNSMWQIRWVLYGLFNSQDYSDNKPGRVRLTDRLHHPPDSYGRLHASLAPGRWKPHDVQVRVGWHQLMTTEKEEMSTSLTHIFALVSSSNKSEGLEWLMNNFHRTDKQTNICISWAPVVAKNKTGNLIFLAL